MKPESPRPIPPRRRQPRVPLFRPVPLRTRRDGWTVQRQIDFIGYLAETGSVMAAAEMVGMSRKAAYALRSRPGAESLAAAWDAALGLPKRKVTRADTACCQFEDRIRLRFFRGRYVGSSQVPDIAALLRQLRRLDRATAGAGEVFGR